MLCILIVKTAEDSDKHTLDNDKGIAHDTSILKYICLPWAKTQRGFCADFCFASVSSAEELMKLASDSLELSRLPQKNSQWHTHQVLSLIKTEVNKKVKFSRHM